MFKKKHSFRGSKELPGLVTSSSSPDTAIVSNNPHESLPPRPPPMHVAKKVDVSRGSPQPTSIVPPGTKRVLVVGKGVIMTADVEHCDAVIVQGNLDGNITAKYVVIMKGGVMRGRVECEEADIAGSFEGVEIIADFRLTLSSTARVGGKTTYHRLSVHEGAILTGELVNKPTTRKEINKPPKSPPSKNPSPIREAVSVPDDADENGQGTLLGQRPPTPDIVEL